MAEILTDLLAAGFIENLGGFDERIEKIERAARALAIELCANPPDLIRAILAGLDPDIPQDDPAIARAEQALLVEWRLVREVFPDTPINILRAILLEACRQAAEQGNNAAILWLTAADTLPLLLLGREESIIRQVLQTWAEQMEESALRTTAELANTPQASFEVQMPTLELTPINLDKTDRQNLLNRLTSVVSSLNINNQQYGNNIQYFANHMQVCSQSFSNQIGELLAEDFDGLSDKLSNTLTDFGIQIQTYQDEVNTATKAMLDGAVGVIEARDAGLKTDQTRLNALWWSEALYSPFLCQSYRKLPPSLAAAVMAFDLLNQVVNPTPASVGYLLAEAVNRLPGAGFGQEFALSELFRKLHQAYIQYYRGWRSFQDLLNALPPPGKGRLSLRDAVVLALTEKDQDFIALVQQIGACGDAAISLPMFAHALFRQEQAVRLANRLSKKKGNQ